MKSFHKLVHSVASLFNTSPEAPPPRVPSDGVHQIWYSFSGLSAEIPLYLGNLIHHFSTVGATVGPDNWYISQVEVFKNKKGLRHELLLATVQRTPRLPSKKEPSSNRLQGETSIEARQVPTEVVIESPIHYLVIELRVYGHPTEESGPNNLSGQSHGVAKDGDRSTSDDFIRWKWNGRKSAVQLLSGRKPVLNDVRHILSKDEMRHAELIGRIDLPEPPTLRPEDDSDSVFDELSKKVYPIPAQGASAGPSSSATPATPSQALHFLSLPALLCLAYTISKDEKHYSIIGTNCYWYCSTILYSIYRYIENTTILPASEGRHAIIIPPMDSNNAIKRKFNKALVEPGSFGIINIVPLPEPEKIARILALWNADWMQIENDISQSRLAWFKRQREAVKMLLNKRVEVAEAALKQVLIERDQAIADKEEVRKRADEVIRKIQESLALKSDTSL